MKMPLKAFVEECRRIDAMRTADGNKLSQRVLDAMDALGREVRVGPRMMILHAVDRLRNIDPAELDEAPGLAVPHWLVLGELVPDPADRPYRKAWAIRTQEMGFTAKQLKPELETGLAARRRQEGR